MRLLCNHTGVDSENDVFLHRFQNYFVTRFNVFVSDFDGKLAVTLPGHTAPSYPFVKLVIQDLLLFLINYSLMRILKVFIIKIIKWLK